MLDYFLFLLFSFPFFFFPKRNGENDKEVFRTIYSIQKEVRVEDLKNWVSSPTTNLFKTKLTIHIIHRTSEKWVRK
jgi:UDP-3-O-acyl-N-acetylglucosamine deacetylase